MASFFIFQALEMALLWITIGFLASMAAASSVTGNVCAEP